MLELLEVFSGISCFGADGDVSAITGTIPRQGSEWGVVELASRHKLGRLGEQTPERPCCTHFRCMCQRCLGVWGGGEYVFVEPSLGSQIFSSRMALAMVPVSNLIDSAVSVICTAHAGTAMGLTMQGAIRMQMRLCKHQRYGPRARVVSK